MLSKLLVPMDDSEMAERALVYALENHPEADVTVLHVVGVPSMMMGDAVGIALEDDIESATNERAEPVFERARSVATERDREIETAVAVGHPARRIVERAEGYDTVLLGSHGRHRDGATRRYLIGNVADTVVRRSPVPVTVVR